MINQINPDILLIQEIGDLPYLNELWMDLNVTNGTKFDFSGWMSGSYEEEERHLAVLSKKFLFNPSSVQRYQFWIFWRTYQTKPWTHGNFLYQ